jgi:hypothetical protein
MPAFTFEKIAPPADGSDPSVASAPVAHGTVPSIAKKQRGVIVQILDRFVEPRAKRTPYMHDEKGVATRRPPQSRD